MQMSPVGDEFDKPGRNFVQGQNVGCGTKFGGGFGHAIHRAAGGILSNGMAARAAQTAQSLGSVPADTGEQYSNKLPIPEACGALKKQVNGRTVNDVIRFTNITKAPRTCEDQMCVTTCDQSHTTRGIVMGFGKPNAELASAIQPT